MPRFVLWSVLCLPACKPPEPATGYLEGVVTIGPLTPAERVDVPKPPIPPEVYASRSIDILKSDGATLVTRVRISPEGTYRVQLPAGSYVIQIAKSGIDRGVDLPKVISVVGGQATKFDIRIDTGLR